MIFSVVCYLPLLEEEVPHTKIELAKKSSNSDNDGADDDCETESDNSTEYYEHSFISWSDLTVADYHYVQDFRFTSALLDDKSTPPPKF